MVVSDKGLFFPLSVYGNLVYLKSSLQLDSPDVYRY